MKPAVSFFAIVCITALMWSVAAVKLTAPADETIVPSNFEVTILKEVTPGVSEEAVIETLGPPSSSSHYDGVTSGSAGKRCQWQSSDGYIVTAWFVDGSLAEIGSTAPED